MLLVTGFTLFGEGLNDVINPLIRARSTAKPEIEEQPGGEGEAAILSMTRRAGTMSRGGP